MRGYTRPLCETTGDRDARLQEVVMQCCRRTRSKTAAGRYARLHKAVITGCRRPQG
jgi:hypothetical protein